MKIQTLILQNYDFILINQHIIYCLLYDHMKLQTTRFNFALDGSAHV